MRLIDDRYYRPAKSGRYLVLKKSGEYDVLHYSLRHNSWNLYDSMEREDGMEIIGWTYLPKKDRALMQMITRED